MNDNLTNNKYRQLFGKTIKTQREALKLSRNKIADCVGVALSTLQAWELGEREPSVTHIIKLSQILRLSISQLFSELDNNAPKLFPPYFSNDYIMPKPVVAGVDKSTNTDEANVDDLTFHKNWFAKNFRVNPQDILLFTVKDDSMGKTFNIGDLLLVNSIDKEPLTGIYLLDIDGFISAKRIQRLPDAKIEISCDNHHYHSYTIDLSQPPKRFAILGKVIWCGKRL